MCDQNVLFVASVEKFPCLYNFNLQEYMKKDITEKAWKEVAAQVTLSVPECKEKWRNLRYSLLRSLKPNADGTLKKKYYLHKSMEFILPFIKSTKGLLATPFEEEMDDDTHTSTQELNYEVASPPQLFDYEFLNTEPENKRKRKEHLKTLQSGQSISESLDSRKLFMLGLMPEINALSEGQMKVFRRKVLALLDDITYEGSETYEDENARGSFKPTQVKPENTEDSDGDDLRRV